MQIAELEESISQIDFIVKNNFLQNLSSFYQFKNNNEFHHRLLMIEELLIIIFIQFNEK